MLFSFPFQCVNLASVCRDLVTWSNFPLKLLTKTLQRVKHWAFMCRFHAIKMLSEFCKRDFVAVI